jgi:hypothetical protein
MNGKSSALGPHLGLAGRVCWPADSSGLIYTGMPGLTERWQIFHNSYPDGVMSRITNDLDSCGSIQLTDFNVPEKSYRLPSPPMAGGSHRAATTTSEVLLIKNFQARN